MDKCEGGKNAANCVTDESSKNLLAEVTPTVPQTTVAQKADAAKSVIPPYLLEEMAKRNPGDTSFQQTLTITEQLKNDHSIQPRVPRDQNSAREVYDAKGQEVHPGDKARFEGEPATGNKEVDLVYDYTGQVRDFYKNVLGRDSIDNKGMKLISTVNYGDNFQNAFWNGKQMTYGHPSEASPFKTFTLLDVTGHEITHGVTQNTAGMFYWGQSGALNEHVSDVFGELIKQKSMNQTADQADWLLGAGIWKDNIHGKAIRDMLHPGTAYDDPKIGKDPQPDNMKNYVRTLKDNGGVHYNSGIPNRAFALFAKSVGGYAWDKPGHIWYEALQHAGMFPSFSSFAKQTIKAAHTLGYDSEIPKLQTAWKEVGVLPSGAKDSLTPKFRGVPTEDQERNPHGPTLPATQRKAG